MRTRAPGAETVSLPEHLCRLNESFGAHERVPAVSNDAGPHSELLLAFAARRPRRAVSVLESGAQLGTQCDQLGQSHMAHHREIRRHRREDEMRDVLGVSRRVFQRENRPERMTDDRNPWNAELLAQRLHVGDERRHRIVAVR